MSQHFQKTIQDEQGRLDAVLANESFASSRSALTKLIQGGQVLVNGQVVKRSYQVAPGDVIELTIPEPSTTDLQAEDIPLDIVYEDDDLIVVNKAQGMVVHPAPGHAQGTLVNALLYHAPLSTINGTFRPGIVHRIDRDTSGLLMVAKNDQAHQALAQDLKAHKTGRHYLALVAGEFAEDEGTIDAPLGRHPKDRKKQAVQVGGRQAVTHFQVKERFTGYTLLELQLETGRTHQIRVHLAYIGHPVVGDPVYGRQKKIGQINLPGQLLHAESLTLTQPKTGQELTFHAPLPAVFQRVLDLLAAQ
ncbi:RluA family pseudouridine synthase [Leuconostocaceae bacterium ESL0958]|nr:RluA family pseudouridine synthase [Leuconostocaceae bacterium ESL0958]